MNILIAKTGPKPPKRTQINLSKQKQTKLCRRLYKLWVVLIIDNWLINWWRVLNATLKRHFWVSSWWSVLWEEEVEMPVENHRSSIGKLTTLAKQYWSRVYLCPISSPMLFNFILVWLYNYFDLSVTDESYVDETRV